jgi:hypothetical protein
MCRLPQLGDYARNCASFRLVEQLSSADLQPA